MAAVAMANRRTIADRISHTRVLRRASHHEPASRRSAAQVPDRPLGRSPIGSGSAFISRAGFL